MPIIHRIGEKKCNFLYADKVCILGFFVCFRMHTHPKFYIIIVFFSIRCVRDLINYVKKTKRETPSPRRRAYNRLSRCVVLVLGPLYGHVLGTPYGFIIAVLVI